MDFVRQVVNSEVLSKFINLPNELKNRQVEIIVLPFSDNQVKPKAKKSMKGALKSYSNVDLIEREKTAWSDAVEEKYADS